LTLAGTGGSGTGAISYALSGGAGTAGCTLDTATGAMTFASAGSCDVTASRAGDDNHLVETSAVQTITVAKAPQVLSFTSSVPEEPLPGGTYAVTVVSDKGLTPSLAITSGSPAVCTLASGTVSFVTTGSCVVSATQAGDGNFLAADAVSQTIAVGSLNQNITFAQPDDMAFGDPDAALTVSASSDLPVTVVSDTVSVCTVSGASVSIVTVGRCELTASQAGDARYAAASSVTRVFDVVASLASAPTISAVSASSGAITVSFTDPGFDGGVSIDAFEVVATPVGSGTVVTDTSCVGSPCTISGLLNGTGYTVTVAAINAAGTGPASVSSPALTPFTNPQAVGGLSGTAGDRSLRVEWDEITNDALGGGTFTAYQLTLSGGASPVVESITDRTTVAHSFTGLDNGTAYTVEIVTLTSANAAVVTGNTATLTAIPATIPGAPRNPTAVFSAPLTVVLSWSEPTGNGGAPITAYTVTVAEQSNRSGRRSAVAATAAGCSMPVIDAGTRVGSCTVSGLSVDSSYLATITPVNRVGDGTSATVTFTTDGYPTPPPPGDDDGGIDDGCIVCATDPDGDDVPTTGEVTAPGVSPGVITVTDGVVTIALTGADDTVSYTDSRGHLVVETPGALNVSGSGLLPTSTVSVFWSSDAMGTTTVPSTGLLDTDLDIPADAVAGVVVVRVDTVGSTGAQRLFRFPVRVVVGSVTGTGDDGGSGGSGGGGTAPPLPGTDDDGDGETDGWGGGPGSGGGGSGGGGGTPGSPTSPCSGCVSVFPAPAPGTPGPEVTSTDPDTRPGGVTVTLPGGGTGTLGTPPGAGGSPTPGTADITVTGDGEVVVSLPGTVPVSGSGALPGTTVTVYVDGIPVGTTTVRPDGTYSIDVTLPPGIDPGRHVIRVDSTDATGDPRTVLFGVTVIGMPPPGLPGTDADGDGAIDGWSSGGSGGDPTRPCAGCVSVFPAPAPGAEQPSVSMPPAPSNGQPIVVTLPAAGGVATTVSVGGATSNGSTPMWVTGDGTPTVAAGSTLPIRLDGLEPGSTVAVWLGDVLLGTAEVAADGTVAFDVVVPASPLGAGMLRIDMVRADGTPASVLLGIAVAATATGTLPVTGRDDLAIAWAVLIAALGALATLTGRGRRRFV
ncbi:MAG: hypothetical protein RIR49_37, partial [Actinomycetota bacterium]